MIPSIKKIFLFAGIALTGYGYHLLSVPPDTDYEQVLIHARSGMFFVLAGGTCLMIWLAKR